MKLLLHSCCAPCSILCIEALRKEALEPTLFWYNPNIHPFTEYRSRRDALSAYAKAVDARLVMQDVYGLREFIRGVYPALETRCRFCYAARLNAAAGYAAANGFQAFSSTLLISPYQNHALLCEVAGEAAKKHRVEFLYRDFRPLFREGQKRARELGIYMQKYCGCIFSEEERYLHT